MGYKHSISIYANRKRIFDNYRWFSAHKAVPGDFYGLVCDIPQSRNISVRIKSNENRIFYILSNMKFKFKSYIDKYGHQYFQFKSAPGMIVVFYEEMYVCPVLENRRMVLLSWSHRITLDMLCIEQFVPISLQQEKPLNKRTCPHDHIWYIRNFEGDTIYLSQPSSDYNRLFLINFPINLRDCDNDTGRIGVVSNRMYTKNYYAALKFYSNIDYIANDCAN